MPVIFNEKRMNQKTPMYKPVGTRSKMPMKMKQQTYVCESFKKKLQ